MITVVAEVVHTTLHRASGEHDRPDVSLNVTCGTRPNHSESASMQDKSVLVEFRESILGGEGFYTGTLFAPYIVDSS